MTSPASTSPARRLGVRLALLSAPIALTVVMASATASGVPSVNSTPDQFEPHAAMRNHPSYWEEWLHDGSTCTKFNTSQTPYELAAAPAGRSLRLLVIKAGAGEQANAIWNSPQRGAYSHPSGKRTSHATVCTKPDAPTPTDPAPVPTDPAPVPTDPAPAPTDPAPAPTDPAPIPTDPAPIPTDPQPDPSEPPVTSPSPPGPSSSGVLPDHGTLPPQASTLPATGMSGDTVMSAVLAFVAGTVLVILSRRRRPA